MENMNGYGGGCVLQFVKCETSIYPSEPYTVK